MGIQVIGAGLGRTGTMFLKKTLEQLGYGDCFHMVELLKKPERLRYIKEVQKQKKQIGKAFLKDMVQWWIIPCACTIPH